MTAATTRPADEPRTGAGTRRRARQEARDAAASPPRDAPPEGSSPGPPPRRDRRAGRPLPTAGTVWKLVAVLGVLGTVGLGLAWRGAESRATTADGLAPEVVDMRSAGREFAIALTNFDAATIDADFDRIVEAASGEFAEEADRFYDEDIRARLRDAQATSRSEIRDLYVQSFAGDSGELFVVVDQTVANNRSPQPITDTLRIELGMALVEERWTVRSVEVLDAPPGAQADMTGLAEDAPAAEAPTTPGG